MTDIIKSTKEGNNKLTNFIIKDFRYSENYFKGLAVVTEEKENSLLKEQIIDC